MPKRSINRPAVDCPMKAPKPLKAITKAVLAGEMPLSRNNAGVHSVTTVSTQKPMKNGTHNSSVPAARPSLNKCRIGAPGSFFSSITKWESGWTSDERKRATIFRMAAVSFRRVRRNLIDSGRYKNSRTAMTSGTTPPI